MTENRDERRKGYCLATADTTPKLTKREEELQAQMEAAAILRKWRPGGNQAPSGFLKTDDKKANAPHSTVEKNISQSSSQGSTVEKNISQSSERTFALSSASRFFTDGTDEPAANCDSQSTGPAPTAADYVSKPQ